MAPRASRTGDSRLLAWAVKLAIFSSTALLAWGAYDFRSAANDLKEINAGFAALTTRVALNERDIANNSANDVIAVKRIGRLEGRVFQIGGSLEVPGVSLP